MYDLATIRKMERETGRHAKKEKFEPLVARYNGDELIFKCPDLGNYIPEGWRLIQEFFVDKSGFGQPGEMALTASQFISKVREGLGYAITQTGQFQVYIGEFEEF